MADQTFIVGGPVQPPHGGGFPESWAKFFRVTRDGVEVTPLFLFLAKHLDGMESLLRDYDKLNTETEARVWWAAKKMLLERLDAAKAGG